MHVNFSLPAEGGVIRKLAEYDGRRVRMFALTKPNAYIRRLLHRFSRCSNQSPLSEGASLRREVDFDEGERRKESAFVRSDKAKCIQSQATPPDYIESFSLRLGHLRGLTVHRTVIQYPQAASLLAAARSQNGSGIINAIHYRFAASLPLGGSLTF